MKLKDTLFIKPLLLMKMYRLVIIQKSGIFHTFNRAQLSGHCSLGQNVYISRNVTIGNNVKIQNNVSVFEGVELEDFVFCGPSSYLQMY